MQFEGFFVILNNASTATGLMQQAVAFPFPFPFPLPFMFPYRESQIKIYAIVRIFAIFIAYSASLEAELIGRR